jgi:hypothetical protein
MKADALTPLAFIVTPNIAMPVPPHMPLHEHTYERTYEHMDERTYEHMDEHTYEHMDEHMDEHRDTRTRSLGAYPSAIRSTMPIITYHPTYAVHPPQISADAFIAASWAAYA